VKPRQIILAGDSAGGNLVCAVTIMAIERKFRVPDGLLLAYPGKSLSSIFPLIALNLSMTNNFVPSLLLSLDDPILPFPFLKMCLESYIGEGLNPETNYYISPGVAPDSILQQFPQTRIMVASNDPLRDQSFQFALRMV